MELDQSNKRISIRCDACLKGHRQCSRSLPKCNDCIEKDIECEYNFQAKYKKKLFGFEENILKFNIKDTGEKKVKKKRPRKEYTVIKFYKYELTNSLSTTPSHLFSRNKSLEKLMSLLQYPISNNYVKKVPIFLTIFKNLGITITKLRKPASIDSPLTPITLSSYSILKQAYECYFKFNNNSAPLFIQDEIKFNSKSHILKAAILASGLAWMEPTEATDKLLIYLRSKIYEYVKNIYQIKPTLDNLQIILVSVVGINSLSWTNSLKTKLMKHAYFIATTIGCHFSSCKLSKYINNERALAYSFLTYAQVSFNLILSSYVPVPFKQVNLAKMSCKLIDYLSSPKSKTISYLNSLNYNYTVLLSSFYNDVSIMLFLLKILKSKYQLNKDLKTADKLSIDLLNKNKNIIAKYLKSLQLLSIKYTTKRESQLINNLKDYILFLYHFFNYFINSLHFYRPHYFQNANHKLTIEDRERILGTLNECDKVIHYGFLLPPFYMRASGFGYVPHCLIFMLRYKDKVEHDFSSTILKGMQYLENLSKVASFSFVSHLSLQLINLVKVHFCK